MAEMTVVEAIATVYHVLDLSFEQRNQIAALLEQQAEEIAKKDRMIEMACDRLSNYRKCPPEVCDLPYHPGDIECCKHWRKWLEKEAQVRG